MRRDVLTVPWAEVLEVLDGLAADGDAGAARLLRSMVEFEAAGGSTDSVVWRLACRRYLGNGGSSSPESTTEEAQNGR